MVITQLAPFLPWVCGGLAALALLVVYSGVRQVVGRRRPEPDGPQVDYSALTEPGGWEERTDRDFRRTVEESDLGLDAPTAVGWMAFVGVALGAGLFLWRGDLSLAALGFAFGVGGVWLTARIAHGYWRRRLQGQLPDALFLLSRSLRAGLSLEQSIGLVGQSGEQPLAREFRRCAEHLRLGAPVPTALAVTAKRVRLLDFDVFASLVSLYKRVGGNLTLLLDRLATGVRDRNLYRGHVRSATALGRLSGIFVAAAGPIMFACYYLWQPEYVQTFFAEPVGMIALGVAAVLWLVGVAWLLWLFRVDD